MTDTLVLSFVAVFVVLAVAYVLLMKAHRKAALIADTGGADKPTDPTDASGWRLGPVVYGFNQSIGVPETPEPATDGIWSFEVPVGQGLPKDANGHPVGPQVHAATFNHGPLIGKKLICAKFRVDLPEGVKIVPQTAKDLPSMVSLFFQQKGDNYSAGGIYESYRWYSADVTCPVTAGVHKLVAPLDTGWTATQTSTLNPADLGGVDKDGNNLPKYNPVGFKKAIDHAEAVGLVFGGGDGRAHGFYATGPGARFTLLEFVIDG